MIKEIAAKSIIIKSNLPDADYVINPYVGCTHACIYCYACFMKRFTGHKEEWGQFLDIKINAAGLIPDKSLKGKFLFMSSVTDPYMPIEKKYRLTRSILERLVLLEPTMGIQTKSALVVRDIDLFRQLDCEVGITITTIDDSLRKEVEPAASSVGDRIDALKKLKKAGIKTYVFIGPILPGFTDWKAIIQKTKNYSDAYLFENLNVRGSIWDHINKWLKKHPELLEKYEEIYFSKNTYWDDVETAIRTYCRKEKVECKVYFHHGS